MPISRQWQSLNALSSRSAVSALVDFNTCSLVDAVCRALVEISRNITINNYLKYPYRQSKPSTTYKLKQLDDCLLRKTFQKCHHTILRNTKHTLILENRTKSSQLKYENKNPPAPSHLLFLCTIAQSHKRSGSTHKQSKSSTPRRSHRDANERRNQIRGCSCTDTRREKIPYRPPTKTARR